MIDKWVRVVDTDVFLNVAALVTLRVVNISGKWEMRGITLTSADLILGRYATRGDAVAAMEELVGAS